MKFLTMYAQAALQASSLPWLLVVRRGLKKDFVTISPFALKLVMTIVIQGEPDLFNICVPKIVLGNRRCAN